MAIPISQFYPTQPGGTPSSLKDAAPEIINIAADVVNTSNEVVLNVGTDAQSMVASGIDDSNFSADGNFLIYAGSSLADEVRPGDSVELTIDGTGYMLMVEDVNPLTNQTTLSNTANNASNISGFGTGNYHFDIPEHDPTFEGNILAADDTVLIDHDTKVFNGGIADNNDGDGLNIWTGTQTEYDNLSSYDNNTIYHVTPDI